jgi:hypothetical protein
MPRFLLLAGLLAMRIPFVGPSEALSSLAVAASESTNVYPEVVETPDDAKAKNHVFLKKLPGVHEAADTGAAAIRGLWSGGGYLYVIAGNSLYKYAIGTYVGGNPSTGALALQATYPHALTAPYVASDPAQMFANGNQLGIVTNGKFYYNNGTANIEARFLLEGTATAVGAVLTRTGGNEFTAAMVGRTITINGENLTVTVFTGVNTVTVSGAPAGGKSGTVAVTAGGFVWWTSGSLFTADMVGQPIVINGITYTVSAYGGPGSLQVSDAGIPTGTGLAYSTILTNMPWSCDGGDLVTAETGAYLAGQAWVQRPAGGSPDLGRQVNMSDPFDFRTWRGLNFKQKEASPDYIQAIHADRGQLYIMGTEGSEVWALSPSTGLPERIPGAEASEGLVARHSVVSIAQSMFFVGGSPKGQAIAYRMRGFVPVRISTHAVEQTWSSASIWAEQLRASAYTSNGHQFVEFHSTGALTWVYDVTASDQLGYPVWHRRAKWDTGTNAWTTYPYWMHTYIPEWGNGMHLVANPSAGKIYEMSDDYYDDAGADIAWRKAIPYRYNGGHRIFFGRQTLEMEAGTVASGAEPTITRDYSDDRGRTFVNPQTAGFGVHDEFSRRVYWPAGGSSRGRVWRYFGKDKNKTVLIDLQAEEVAGTV